MNRAAPILSALALSALGGQAIGGQPELTSWKINTTGETGISLDADMDAEVSQYLADVHSVRYTSTDVYIESAGIPSYPVGLFPGNPGVPSDTEALWQLPRNPQPETGTTTSMPLGATGVLVNGVAFYDQQDGMSYNNAGIWVQNAGVAELGGFDPAQGHPSPIFANAGGDAGGGGMGGPPDGGGMGPPAGEGGMDAGGGMEATGGYYHHHIEPNYLRDQMGDDGSRHSPILGFAFDGFPVYGPYGYSDPTDATSEIRLIKSGYRLRAISDRSTLPDGTALAAASHGPAISDAAPLGYYQQDFEHVEGLGDLNKHNVRFTVTPEYPEGTYAYYVTLDDNGDSSYPYIIGDSYFGQVVDANLSNSVVVPGDVATFSNPLPSSTPGEGEWFASDWYGFYNLSNYPWLYHSEHGWQYPFSESDDSSLWVYDAAQGWLWTNESNYSYLWNSSAGSWVFYLEGSAAPRWFYDFGVGDWTSSN